jgi:hypothetical protein
MNYAPIKRAARDFRMHLESTTRVATSVATTLSETKAHPSHQLAERSADEAARLRQALEFVKAAEVILEGLPA